MEATADPGYRDHGGTGTIVTRAEQRSARHHFLGDIMPRFQFHVRTGNLSIEDTVGTEFPELGVALQEAESGIAFLADELPGSGVAVEDVLARSRHRWSSVRASGPTDG
jgi:hypothetical protein